MDQQNMGGEVKKGHGIHWMCCWVPMFGSLAFAWGVLSLIFAFVAGEGVFWGMNAVGWMWSGLVAGVLAMSGTRKKLGACKMGGGSCGGCGDKGKCSSC